MKPSTKEIKFVKVPLIMSCGPMIELSFSMLTGKTVKVSIDPEATIEELKAKI